MLLHTFDDGKGDDVIEVLVMAVVDFYETLLRLLRSCVAAVAAATAEIL